MVNLNKILILTSGKSTKLDAFNGVSKASFDDVNYSSDNKNLCVNDKDLKDFSIIYFRMVGKSLEIATLVAGYAKENGIKIVDRIYESSLLMPLSLGKSIEIKKLLNAGVTMPKTVFNNFEKLPYPFVVKSTTGQRGREVWLVKDKMEMKELRNKFEKNKFYFAQEFIEKAKRARVLVIGDKVMGGILRQTKWNKNETKETLNPVPIQIAELALMATKAIGLDICGVDILVDEKNNMFVIEANAAPSWNLINKYCGVIVEDEIIKYLQNQF